MSEATESVAKKKTTYTPVQMEDQSTVEFPGETKITTEVNGGSVKFNFRNGKVLNADINAGGLTQQFAIHGLTQKLRDEAAGEKDVDDAFEAIASLYARLKNGEWSVKREGGGFGGQSILVQALSRVYSRTIEEIRTYLDSGNDGKPFTQGDKIKMRQHPKVKAVIDELEAAKAAVSPGSAVDLLAGLGRNQ